MKNDSRKSFTLIELLVVVAIIAILAGLIFPALDSVRNNARKSKANSECQALYTAIVAYETENSRYPAKPASTDGLVNTDSGAPFGGADYAEMCRYLTGTDTSGNTKNKKVYYEANMGYKSSGNDGILDPWGNSYQVVIDWTYDGKVSYSNAPKPVQAVIDATGRTGNDKDIRKSVLVYSFGVKADDVKDYAKMAKQKKFVTSW